jgi:hypothetical protein
MQTGPGISFPSRLSSQGIILTHRLVSIDKLHFKECLIELMHDMFGKESVPRIFHGEKLYMSMDNKKANVRGGSQHVREMLASSRLYRQSSASYISNLHFIFLRHSFKGSETILKNLQLKV